MRKRTPTEVHRVTFIVKTLQCIGLRCFPLAHGTKRPRDKGWQSTDYSTMDWRGYLAAGGGYGVAFGPDQFALDVDPRNGGLLSFAVLQLEAGDDFSRYMRVDTGRGDGGFHIYMRKPSDLRLFGRGYPGIDFKRMGGFVVGPGSLHPETGKPYRLACEAIRLALLQAPDELLAMLKLPERPPRIHGGGEVTDEQLGRLLAALDPKDFRDYDDWIRIMAAAHDATNGDGFEVVQAWCDRDPDYAGREEENRYHWDSFEAGKPDGVSIGTIFALVRKAGRSRLVTTILMEMDFATGNVIYEADMYEIVGTVNEADMYEIVGEVNEEDMYDIAGEVNEADLYGTEALNDEEGSP